MAKPKRARKGGQLNRSETITVRLDPKLNYLCELGARSQRRTKSSLVEAALAEALNSIPLDPRPTAAAERPSISGMAEILWHVNEIERLRRLAALAPQLMTYDEQRIWAVLTSNGFFWQGAWEFYGQDQGMFRPDIRPEKLVLERVQEFWVVIREVALGKKPAAALPQPTYFFPWDERMHGATMTPQAPQLPDEEKKNG